MIASHLLLLWLRQTFTTLYRLFSLLFLDHQVDDMFLDELVVLDQTALHHGDPLILRGQQLAQTYLP